MKVPIEKQRLTEAQRQSKKPRFKIEKLEERIAPRARCAYHYNPHAGKWVGNYGRHCGR